MGSIVARGGEGVRMGSVVTGREERERGGKREGLEELQLLTGGGRRCGAFADDQVHVPKLLVCDA
jgi:hypothetical protein